MGFLLPSYFILLLLLHPTSAEVPSGTIDRTVKQQILATILPADQHSSQIFLASPSGKYAAYFIRHVTAAAAGGFGNDFCFIQVEDTHSSESVWESECSPISTSNACELIFDDNGLEVFDGSREAWSAEANGFHPNTLQLVDLGDMRITDKDGELAWKASDMPRSNQGCGLRGSPGLTPDSLPFAGQMGAGGSLPFGLQAPARPSQVASVAGDSASAFPAEPEADEPVVVDGGLAPGQPPVVPMAAPLGDLSAGGGENSAFGQPAARGPASEDTGMQFGMPAAALNVKHPAEGGAVLSGEPLVDNTPYDSGCIRGLKLSGVRMALSALVVVVILN